MEKKFRNSLNPFYLLRKKESHKTFEFVPISDV